jgi:hypothetical protein
MATAGALVYGLAHAKEYKAHVADPFGPQQRFGVISMPKLEAGKLRAIDVAGAVTQDIKHYLKSLSYVICIPIVIYIKITSVSIMMVVIADSMLHARLDR